MGWSRAPSCRIFSGTSSRSARRHNLRIANVFHAGDGNIHPILLFDERDAEQVKRVFLASHEILDECIAVGGSVTGEHGIGVEKMEFMPKLFSPEDLAAMVAIRNTFNPEGRCNPSKMLPGGAGCIERKTPGTRRRPEPVVDCSAPGRCAAFTRQESESGYPGLTCDGTDFTQSRDRRQVANRPRLLI